jgi:subtilisin family serine protease
MKRGVSRYRAVVLCATVVAGVVFAASPGAQQVIQQVSVRQVRAPTIVAPKVEPPRVIEPRVPQSKPQAQLPTIPADLLAAYTEAAERGLNYLPGRVLVKFKQGVGRDGRQRALQALTSRPSVDGLEWIGDIAIVKDPTQTDARVLAAQMGSQPEVEFAEPDYLQHPTVIPTDPSYAVRQWNLAQIGMPRAWDLAGGGSAQVIVAVVDTGVTAVPLQNVTVQTWNGGAIVNYSMPVGPSPDFTLSRFVSPRDFTISTSAPPAFVVDTDGHGSHVAGTVGEDTNNGIALAGVAYNVRIMPLKACQSYWDVQFARSAAGIPGFAPTDSGGCPSSATAAAIRFAADNGAKVLNYSIGGTSQNMATRDAMVYAVSRGVFIAMSNGNEFNDGNPTTFPAFFAPSIQGAVSVAAVTRSETRASYSSTGSFTEIAAPGGDGTNPIYQASIRFSDSNESFVVFPRFDRYDERGMAGTSMASPHVAGSAALLISYYLQRNVTLSPGTIEGILTGTTKDLGSRGRDNDFGLGLVQPFRALYGLGLRR